MELANVYFVDGVDQNLAHAPSYSPPVDKCLFTDVSR